MSEQLSNIIEFSTTCVGWGRYNEIGRWPYLELNLQTAGIHISPEIFEQ